MVPNRLFNPSGLLFLRNPIRIKDLVYKYIVFVEKEEEIYRSQLEKGILAGNRSFVKN